MSEAETFPPEAEAAFAQADALMIDAIMAAHARQDGMTLIGLAGPQGSGKSSTAQRLVTLLGGRGARALSASLDDFYSTREERRRLAATVHPLLATRGAPGTHDLDLLDGTIGRLSAATAAHSTPVPAFDKTTDDRLPREQWPMFEGRPDIFLLEGWCVGARPQPADQLARPINALEAEEDADGAWRRFVNDRLATDYAALFAKLDLLVQLIAPSFDCIFDWRAEQERKLERSAGARPPMTAPELQRFIAHYERVTRWMMADRPGDLLVSIDPGRKPLRYAARSASSDG